MAIMVSTVDVAVGDGTEVDEVVGSDDVLFDDGVTAQEDKTEIIKKQMNNFKNTRTVRIVDLPFLIARKRGSDQRRERMIGAFLDHF